MPVDNELPFPSLRLETTDHRWCPVIASFPLQSRHRLLFWLHLLLGTLVASFTVFAHAQTATTSTKPRVVPMPASIEAPRDLPFPGKIRIEVDATDVRKRVFQVHEVVPVASGAPLTLLFPQWSQGDHSPNGPLEKLAGLVITSSGHRVEWVRDPVQVYAFHVNVPSGATTLDVTFQYLGSTGSTTGAALINSRMFDLQWQSAVLYPAGYFSRDITFEPSITLPAGWTFFSALDGANRKGDRVDFAPVALDTLVDSPVMAGVYAKQVVLSTQPVKVNLDVVADDVAGLARLQEAAESFKPLQTETINFFGGIHYTHYDHMLWLSNDFGPVYYEHHQSGENSGPANLLQAGTGPAPDISFIEHGFIHSWNVMFRRPAEMWTANLNTPERDSMFWVFEGLTVYWSDVLAVRAGVSKEQEVLDGLAENVAMTSMNNGAQWRSLQDVNNSPVFAFRKASSWPTWQRNMFDAYSQGDLIWLGVDVLIRQQTANKRSLDNFAKSFFGLEDGRVETRTYTFDEMIEALNRVSPYDWKSYFRARLDEYGTGKSIEGIQAGGYKLIFVAEATPAGEAKTFLNLAYSLGMQVGSGGRIVAVHWSGPASQAGLIPGGTIKTVNEQPYDPVQLEELVAKGGTIALTVVRAGVEEKHSVQWQGGLRQPKLVRDEPHADLLSKIFERSPG